MKKNVKWFLGIVGIVFVIVLVGGVVYYISDRWERVYDHDDKVTQEDLLIVVSAEDVASREDCTEIERYDAAQKTCFFTCSTEQECDAKEQDIDEILDVWDKEYDNFSQNFTEFAGDIDTVEEKAEIIYAIENGEYFRITFGEESDSHQKVKEWLKRISPDDFSDRHLRRLILVTDMEDDTAAFVVPHGADLATWDVFVNIQSLREDGNKEMVFTLVHEFAHILTLNTTQIDEETGAAACQNYFVPEGCVQHDAYLNVFYEKFWKNKNFDLTPDDSLDNYDKKPSAFVTEYAATNPGEDIAESFARFVFQKQEDHLQTVAQQKVYFFYAFPELVEMRSAMRRVMQSFVRKSVR